MTNGNVLLSCRELSLGYEHKALLTGLSLDICEGDYLCIMGENGGGKSTFIKSILGLTAPLAGEIVRSEEVKRHGIGYLPQQTGAQKDFPATVEEVVLSGFVSAEGRLFGYSAEQKSRALMNMGKLGILEKRRACYRELSGGQQQRVLLARALCAASHLLVLDEPVTGLDAAAAQDLYKTLRYLNEKEHMAIVMVSHDMPNALREAKQILHIGAKQVFLGSVNDFLLSPQGRRFGGETR